MKLFCCFIFSNGFVLCYAVLLYYAVLSALPNSGSRVTGGIPGTDLNAMMRQFGGAGAAGMPRLEDMQAQLTQNPEMMNQLMSSPMMQNLMSNPDIIREMMTSNPQMQAMLDSNPHIRHILNDPAVSSTIYAI